MSSNITSPVTLQPPGAGLPAFELALLRIYFRWACIVTSQDAAMQRFRLEGEKVVSLAHSVPATQNTVRVLIGRITGIEDSSRYWSVFMVLDHLRIVDEGITRIIEELSNDRPVAQEVRIQDVKPTADAGPDVVERFIKSVASYEATVNRLGKLGRLVRHPHPWFGPLTAHDWHCLAGIHHGVHRRQIEQIKKALDHATVADC
jgi:hypothetical protein